jgi:hypothetical protein
MRKIVFLVIATSRAAEHPRVLGDEIMDENNCFSCHCDEPLSGEVAISE